MAARTRSSLLLLVTLIAASSLSGASAFDLVHSEGLYGRRLLPESRGDIESKPSHTFFSKGGAAPQVKTDNVYTGFNRGGAVLHLAAQKAVDTAVKESTKATEPRTADTFYSRTLAAQKVKTDNIHAGFNRGGAIRNPAEAPKKVASDEQTKAIEPRATHTYQSRTSSSRQVKIDNAYTAGFNRGGAILHPAAPKTVDTADKESTKAAEPRTGDTSYSRRTLVAQKVKTDNIHAGFNRGGAVRHPAEAPKKVYTDEQTNDNEPRAAETHTSRISPAHHVKIDNAYTGFNRGRAVRHSDTHTEGRTDALYTAGFNRGGAVFHPPAPPAPTVDYSGKQTTAVGTRTAHTYYSRTLEAHQAKTNDAYTGFNRGRAVLH